MDALMVEKPRPAETEQRWRAVLAARHESYDRNLEKDNPERPWYNKPHFQGDVEAECKLWARVSRALGEAYARDRWDISTIEFDPKQPEPLSHEIPLNSFLSPFFTGRYETTTTHTSRLASVASMNGGAILAPTPHLAPTWTRP